MSERRSTDPIASGLSDAMEHGFRGVERVAEAFRESLELRARRARPVTPPTPMPAAMAAKRAAGPDRAGWERRSAPAEQRVTGQQRTTQQGTTQQAGTGPRHTASGALAEDLTRIGAEVLDRMGEVAQDVARAIGGTVEHEAADAPHEHLGFEAIAGGDEALDEFTVWNTGALRLKQLAFRATDLLGAEGAIDAGAVTFDPPSVDEVAPRTPATVKISVEVPAETPAGVYRGLVVAHPGDAYAVITIVVSRRPKGEETEEASVSPEATAS